MLQAQMDLLVIEAQSGNIKAYECLVEYFQPILIKFAYSLNSNYALADDAVQETWLTIGRKLRSLKDPRLFKSWLFQVVRWRVIDLARSTKVNHRSLEQLAEPNNDELCEPLDETELENRQLKRAIAQLEPIERSVIQLFYLAELSIADIALVLNTPQGTVKSRLNRARKQLHQLISN